MGRTNVVVDDALVAKVMGRYGLRTKREAIDFALRRAAGTQDPYELALSLRGSGWDGDLAAMRDSDPIEEF
jgi:Arc/MetJ family transcription regulator